MKYLFTATVILALIAIPLRVAAHEYWLEPDSFFVKAGQQTGIHLFVGQALKKDEERTYRGSQVTSFQMFSPMGNFDLRSMADEDKSPILRFGGERPGAYLLDLERGWSYITLDGDKFEDYLREEGMEYIIAERARLGESGKPGRERYSRSIKTLLQIGDVLGGSAKERAWSKLEIVPLDNPYSRKAGDKIGFQFWFDGRPLANKTVFADNRDGIQFSTIKLTTDANGKVSFKLATRGVWLIRSVHMQRCEKKCGDSDWESFWATFTFGLK